MGKLLKTQRTLEDLPVFQTWSSMDSHVLVIVALLSKLPAAVLTFKILNLQMHLHVKVVIPLFIENFSAVPKSTLVDHWNTHIMIIVV